MPKQLSRNDYVFADGHRLTDSPTRVTAPSALAALCQHKESTKEPQRTHRAGKITSSSDVISRCGRGGLTQRARWTQRGGLFFLGFPRRIAGDLSVLSDLGVRLTRRRLTLRVRWTQRGDFSYWDFQEESRESLASLASLA